MYRMHEVGILLSNALNAECIPQLLAKALEANQAALQLAQTPCETPEQTSDRAHELRVLALTAIQNFKNIVYLLDIHYALQEPQAWCRLAGLPHDEKKYLAELIFPDDRDKQNQFIWYIGRKMAQ